MCLCVVNDPHHGTLLFGGAILVCVYLMRGEYDDRLVWPFRGDITVRLVNQSSDQDHVEVTFKFSDMSSISESSCSRVTSGERARNGYQVMFFLNNEIQYVKDDCVKLRVTKVLVHMVS